MPYLTRRAAIATAAAFASSAARAPDAQGDLVEPGPVGTLPITHEGGVCLQVSVNGEPPAPFLFDTGATMSTLDAGFAALHGLSPSGGGKARGIKGGLEPLGLLQGLHLSAAGIDLPPQDCGVLAFPNHIADRGARPRLAGIIGIDGFGPHIIRLDLANRQLTLLPGDAAPDPAGIDVPLATSMRYNLQSQAAPLWQRATIKAKVDGLDVALMLDTGSNGYVHFNQNCVRANDLLGRYAKHIDIRTPGGIDGALLTSICSGARLDIGPVTIGNPILSLAREEADPPGAINFRGHFGDDARRQLPPRETHDGVLGLHALAGFVMFLDFAGQRLVLEPGSAKLAPPGWRTAGLSLDKPVSDYFEVLTVIPGTPAEAAGLRVGDRIVSVNGKSAPTLALFDYGRLESAGPLSLVLASGAAHTINAVTLLP